MLAALSAGDVNLTKDLPPVRLPEMRSWWSALALLVAVRLAIPLAAYADKGSKLPGIPTFVRPAHDGGLQGDATGFYEGARELMAAWGRMPRAVLGLDVLFVLAAAIAIVLLWRRRPELRPWLVPAALFAAGLALSVDIHYMKATGAAVIGWPLVWSLPMFPVRVLGRLTKAVAWDIGTALSLVFVALTVVAVAYLGRNATGRRPLGLLAAAFWTAWPLLVGVIAGHHAWTNNQWDVDVGLHNYDEPLSTLLVTTGAALLLSARLTPMRLALAGCALSVATSVKVSNAIVAGIALVLVVSRYRRGALPYLAGALAFAPVVLVYWPLSYPKLYDNPRSWPHDAFDVSHVVSSWTHSSIFTPHTLAIVVPLAAVGAVALRRRPWQLAIVLAFLLVNPVFYSFFANTAEHPRFLYASLPELFTLWAAGLALLAQVLVRLHVEPHREQGELRA
jgi:hypothetical protein